MSRRLTVVAGASRGLGLEIARALARRGLDLALLARDGAALEALADEIAAGGRARPLTLEIDLAAPGAVDAVLDGLAGVAVEGLVCNAGYGLVGDAVDLDRGAQLGIVDLNIRALTDLTLALLPGLVAAQGRILMVASIAGFTPGPGMAVYYASKAYVVSFGDALGAELKGKGVVVTTLCPGPLETAFWQRAGAKPGLFGRLAATDLAAVAEAGVAGWFAGRRRVTPGALNALTAAFAPSLPRGPLLAITRRVNRARRGETP